MDIRALFKKLNPLKASPKQEEKSARRFGWQVKSSLRTYFYDDYLLVAIVLSVILAVFAAFSLCVFYHMRNYDQVLLYYTGKNVSMAKDIFTTPRYLLYLLTLPPLAALVFYVLTNEVEFSLGEVLCAGFFAFNMVVSLSMEHSELTRIGLPLTRSSLEIVLNILACTGFFILTFCGLHVLFSLLDWKTSSLAGKFLEPQHEKLFFWLAFAAILARWAPVVYACLPGGLHVDTLTALSGFLGYSKMDVSFPILTTILYGSALKLGKLLGGDALGVFFCILVQDLFNALVMAKVAVEVRRYTKSFWWYLATVLFYAISPVWLKASALVLKDVFHTGCFLLFCMHFFACLVEKRSSWKDVVWMGVCMILVSYTRRATYWLAVICVVVLIVSRWKDYWLRYALCLAFVMGLFSFCNSVLYPSLGFNPEREVENYSLPFQQMAMYVKTHDKEITKEEKAVINETLDYERLKTDYTPLISDPIKHLFHAQGKDHSEFFSLFFSFMRKHPLTFVKSFFMGSFEHSNPWYDGERNNNIYLAKNDKFLAAEFRDSRQSWNMNLKIKSYMDVPILRLFNGNGLFSWIMLAMVSYASYRRNLIGFLGIFPAFVLWIGLFMSHVNGLIRYGYPLIAVAPLVCAFCIYGVSSAIKQERKHRPTPKPQPEPEAVPYEPARLQWLDTFGSDEDEPNYYDQ